jgi:hypothetical protein
MRFLSFILFYILCVSVHAQQATDSIKDLSRSRLYKDPVDSTIIPVTIAADPKTGFKDLFVADPEEEGLTQVQLNPRAISGVVLILI